MSELKLHRLLEARCFFVFFCFSLYIRCIPNVHVKYSSVECVGSCRYFGTKDGLPDPTGSLSESILSRVI